MDLKQMGNNTLDYLKNNSADIAATTVVAGGWTAAAMAGGAKIVTGVCLVGGGMFATLVAHETLKQGIKLGFRATKSVIGMIRRVGEKQPEAAPKGRSVPVEERHIVTAS